MGGTQMMGKDSAQHELEEIKRTGVRVYGLIDSDRSLPGEQLNPKASFFSQACAQADIHCHILERRAIDNYLTDHAIKKIKGAGYSALNAFEKLDQRKPCWKKKENAEIAREMKLEDFDNTDLGDFLKQI
jgi:hypothetical protein